MLCFVILGYYCNSSASVHSPTDGLTGDVCPMGFYCPFASVAPEPCPSGYYLSSERNSQPSACIICDPGTYCSSQGLPFPEDNCTQGYYCPEGQVTPTPDNYTCPVGHYCEFGFANPAPCPSGTYQNTEGQWSCNTCMEGFYCNATFGPVVWYGQTVCPEGYYCPNGTEYDTQYPCPRGTFNNRTGEL